MAKPTYDELYAALTKIADPEDACHCGSAGPWQAVAQMVLFGREVDPDAFWTERRLSIEQMLELHGRQ